MIQMLRFALISSPFPCISNLHNLSTYSLIPFQFQQISGTFWIHSHFMENENSLIVMALAAKVNWNFNFNKFSKLRAKCCMFESKRNKWQEIERWGLHRSFLPGISSALDLKKQLEASFPSVQLVACIILCRRARWKKAPLPPCLLESGKTNEHRVKTSEFRSHMVWP